MKVSCKEKIIDKSIEPICVKQTSEVISLIYFNIAKSKDMMNFYWMMSNCYVEHHSNMNGELQNRTTFFKSHNENKCSSSSCEKGGLKNKI